MSSALIYMSFWTGMPATACARPAMLQMPMQSGRLCMPHIAETRPTPVAMNPVLLDANRSFNIMGVSYMTLCSQTMGWRLVASCDQLNPQLSSESFS